jgi:hypothetical protein
VAGVYVQLDSPSPFTFYLLPFTFSALALFMHCTHMMRAFVSRGWACAVLLMTAASSALAQEVRPLEQVPPRPPVEEPRGLIGEPDIVQRAVIFFERRLGNGELTEGWYYGQGKLIPGAGWPSAGAGYRRWLAGDRAVFDTSGSISWRGFKTAQTRLEFPALANSRLLAGAQLRVQDFPEIRYYGEGSGTAPDSRSEYHLKSMNVVGYAIYRPVRWLGVGGSIGVLNPSVESQTVPSYLHGEASLVADTRDYAGHPTSGGLYRAAVSRFSDRDSGAFSFTRYETEAAQFVPLAGSRVVIALHGLMVGTAGTTSNVPFFLQPSLGGNNSLRGYDEYRFHDRHMLLVNAETRLALMTHVDAAVFVDAGNVAARAGDLDLSKRSYGAGLRLHSRRQTFVRIDVARGAEGWRVLLRFDDPLDLARLARRTAPAPFVH